MLEKCTNENTKYYITAIKKQITFLPVVYPNLYQQKSSYHKAKK